MRALASFAMRSRSNAILVAVVSSMLAILLPPLAYLGAGVVGLVTLREGPRAGLLVVVGAALGLAALGFLVFQNAVPALFFLCFLWLPLWLIASLLRKTVSPALAFAGIAVVGLVALLALNVAMADPVPAWRGVLEDLLVPTLKQAGIDPQSANVQAAFDQVAALMNGVLAASLCLGLALSLLLARWWQAQLYNPGGFREEFHNLRFHRPLALLAVGLFVAAWLLPGTIGAFATDLSLTMMVVYLFQGLAVVHGLVANSGGNIGWLVGLYVLMFFALPQVLMLVAVLGVIDAWLDFRTRFARPT